MVHFKLKFVCLVVTNCESFGQFVILFELALDTFLFGELLDTFAGSLD